MDNLEKIFYEVEKVPAEQIAPGFSFPRNINHAVVVTKEDGTKEVVNYCSEVYQLVRNEDVLLPLREELQKHFDIDIKVRQRGVSQFWVDFSLKDFPKHVKKMDALYPRLTVANSFDGRLKYHYSMGVERVICSNGLTVLEEGTRIKKLHTPAIENLTDHSKILEMASEFTSKMDDFVGLYNELDERSVRNLSTRIEDVIEDTGFPPSLEEDVKYRANEEMQTLKYKEATDWLVYNAFNFQLNHNDGTKMKELKKEKLDQEVLTYLRDY